MIGEPLPDSWKWVKLEAVQDPNGRAIVSGPFGSNIGRRFFVDEGVPVIRGNNLTTDMTRFIDEGFVFVTEEKAKELANCQAIPGDLVFTAAGSLGQVGLIPENSRFPKYIISNKQMRARLNRQVVDKLFAYYWFASPWVVQYVERQNTGSSVPLINLSILRSLPLPLPPLAEQKAIVHILDTLDEKIELNRRMNQTLEAIARAIFKSWFVDFDPVWAKMDGEQPYGIDAETASLFPGAFVDSELGPIPEGWRVVELPKAIEVNPRRSLSKGQVAPYLAMADMPTSSALPQSWAMREFNSGMRFINGDVLVARITPCLENGKTAFVNFLGEGEVGWGSTEYIVFRGKAPLPLEYAYFLARTPEFRSHAIVNMTGTSGRQRVPKNCFDHYPVVVPSEQIAARFSEIAGNIIAKMKQNDEQSRTLAELRDTLLPKLISGQLRVPDAEKFVEEVV